MPYELVTNFNQIPILAYPNQSINYQNKSPNQLLEEICAKEGLALPVYTLHTTPGTDQEGKEIGLYMYKVIYKFLLKLVYFKDEKLQFELTLNFTFSDDGEELKTSGDLSDDGKTVNLTLHKWNNSFATEVTKPIELSTNTGERIWVKFKTSADKKNSFRTFHLTIWGEE